MPAKSIFVSSLAQLMKAFFSLFFFTSLYITSFCQIPLSYNGTPGKVKWKEITKNDVRVIYPNTLQLQANKVLNTISYLQQASSASVGEKRNEIAILLKNQTTISNGFVTVGPFRSEFFTTGPQNSQQLAGDWIKLLAIHEHRHTLQFMNTKSEFHRLLGGENSWGVSSFINIPGWYWEGDATIMETALTRLGRGRLPSFSKELRATLLNDVTFSYEKIRNGSYKDIAPNRYPIGYYLGMYGRSKYGNNFWREIIRETTSRINFYPYSTALKRKTGLRSPEFYHTSMKEIKSYWQKEANERTYSTVKKQTAKPSKNNPTLYYFPTFISDTSIVVIKRAANKIAGLYRIDLPSKKETLLTQLGISNQNYISYANNTVVWAEIRLDPRWKERDYSVVMSYNLVTKKKRQLTHKTKYFSPSLSPDGSKLAVVEITPEMENSIKIIDTKSGKLLTTLPNTTNSFLSYPFWGSDGNTLYTVSKQEDKKTIIAYNLQTVTSSLLIEPIENTIEAPIFFNGIIYFSSNFTKVENIYALDISSKKIYPVSSTKFGSYFPTISPKGKEIAFCDYNLNEQSIVTLPLSKPENEQAISIIPPVEQDYYKLTEISTLEGGDISLKISEVKAEPKKYGWYKNLINPHSWLPYFDNVNYGLTLQSTNLLHTLNIDAGYVFNRNDNSSAFIGDIIFSRYYPIFSFSGKMINDRGRSFSNGNFTWNEKVIQAKTEVPLTTNHNSFFYSFTPSVTYNYRKVNYTNEAAQDFQNTNFGSVSYTTTLSITKRLAAQHLLPRLGFLSSVSYEHSLDNSFIDQLQIDNNIYLPGLGANHSILGTAGLIKEKFNNRRYQYQNNFFYSRGYGIPLSDQFKKVSVNYFLPLFYPDAGIRGVLYSKRIFANLFYDHGINTFRNTTELMRSVGGELYVEIDWFRLAPFTVGLRYAHTLDDIANTVVCEINRSTVGLIFANRLSSLFGNHKRR
ncbi:MAG: TolB family protein [Cyclobacteriaceae bacterium]